MKPPPLHDLVVYHSPHFLRGSDPMLHAKRIEEFLVACTVDLETEELVIQVRTGPLYSPERTQPLISDFTRRWGPPAMGLELVSTKGNMETHKWAPTLTFQQLLDIVVRLQGSRHSPLPMLSVSFAFQFRLVDPETNHALPRQNWSRQNLEADEFCLPHGFSKFWGNLGESSGIGALISFPFAADDRRLLPYLRHFQRKFPVRLSVKSSNWHWWKVRKDGMKHHRRGAIPAFGGSDALKLHLSEAIKAK